MEGEIVMIDQERAFGFIKIEGRDKDLFFHLKECPNKDFASFKKGDKVTLTGIGSTERGEVALNVCLIS